MRRCGCDCAQTIIHLEIQTETHTHTHSHTRASWLETQACSQTSLSRSHAERREHVSGSRGRAGARSFAPHREMRASFVFSRLRSGFKFNKLHSIKVEFICKRKHGARSTARTAQTTRTASIADGRDTMLCWAFPGEDGGELSHIGVRGFENRSVGVLLMVCLACRRETRFCIF